MNIVQKTKQANNFYKIITPVIISVFVVYLTMGMALGVLSVFVKNDLKFSTLIVGLVIGMQSLATLLTRAYSGKITDTKGAKKSYHSGVILVIIAGGIYLIAVGFVQYPILALVLLLLARCIHGVSESLFVTGVLTWGIGLVGQQQSGKVMTWNGIAMYGGIAAGAPLSIWLNNEYTITYAFALMLILPLVGWLSTIKLPAHPVDKTHVRLPFYKVLGLIAREGYSLAFASMAYGCIVSFIALLFAEKGWGDASLAFATFATCYILVRVFFSSLPDKYGGFKVALFSLIIELVGQLLVWSTYSKTIAVIGCSLTGMGFSFVFPSLGVLAIKKVKPQMRGTALGAFAAFFDLSIGVTGPLAGLIADWINYQTVYLYGSISCILAILTILYKSNIKKSSH